jgi:membrane-associated phospholipid phosphatase
VLTVAVMVAFALVVGVLVTLAVKRFPGAARVADPAIPAATIATEVREHPGLAARLRQTFDPATAAGLALVVAAVLVVAGGLAVGVLLVMFRANIGLARWDLSAARWGARHATEASTDVLRGVSMLGGTTVIVLLGIVVAATEYRRTRHKAVIAFVVLVLAGQSLICNLIKWLVDRARPEIDQLTGHAGSSFPSGHSAAAAATYAAFALLLSRGRRPWTRAILAGSAAGIAAAVATTRVMLGVHWLTDVLAGLALGWAWFALCSIAMGGRVMRFGAPIATAERIAPAPPDPAREARDATSPS